MTGPHEAERPLHEPIPRAERRPVVTARRVVAVVLFALVLTFLVQNGRSTRMHFLGLSFSLPVGVALVVSFVVGAVLALIATAARRRRVRARARQH